MMNRAYGIREIANWILDYADSKGAQITNMALNKLIYFAYERSLILHGRKLTNAKIEAWEHGPVFREVYRSFKDCGSNAINTRAYKYNPVTDSIDVVVPEISKNDEYLIETSIEDLIFLPASILRDLSHSVGGPWDQAWNHETLSNPGMQITDELILNCHAMKGARQ